MFFMALKVIRGFSLLQLVFRILCGLSGIFLCIQYCTQKVYLHAQKYCNKLKTNKQNTLDVYKLIIYYWLVPNI